MVPKDYAARAPSAACLPLAAKYTG